MISIIIIIIIERDLRRASAPPAPSRVPPTAVIYIQVLLGVLQGCLYRPLGQLASLCAPLAERSRGHSRIRTEPTLVSEGAKSPWARWGSGASGPGLEFVHVQVLRSFHQPTFQHNATYQWLLSCTCSCFMCVKRIVEMWVVEVIVSPPYEYYVYVYIVCMYVYIYIYVHIYVYIYIYIYI